MKINRTLIMAGLSLLLAGAPFIYFSHELAFHRMLYPKLSSGEGAEEDPAARLQWELKRTIDPATGKVPDNIHSLELEFAKTLPTHEEVYGTKMNKGMSDWVARGPYNVGGRTRALALDITNEKIVLAGGVSGGMWRSTDGGNTWAQTTSASQLKTINCVVQDKRKGKENIWYAGTGEAYGGFVVAGDGFYQSVDSGKTWTLKQSLNKPQSYYNMHYVWNIALNPTTQNNTEMYIASYGSILRSTSGGDTVKTALGGKANFLGYYSTFTDVAITPKGVIYATMSNDGGTTSGIFRSTDGITWTNIIPKTFPASYNRIVIGLAPSNENVVYFFASTPGAGFKGVSWDNKYDYNSLFKYTYLSGNGKDSIGGTWEDRSQSLPDYFHHHPWIFGDLTTQGGYDMILKVKPDDENVVFLGGSGLYRSDNGFKDRTKLYWIGGYNHATNIIENYLYPNHHPDQHNLAFLPSNYNTIYSSCDGGVFRSDNALDTAVVWKSLNNGYTTTQFYTVAINQNPLLGHSFSDIIIGGLQDNNSWLTGVKSSPTTPWQPWFRGDGGFCAVIDNDTATFLYTSLQLGKIRKDVFNKKGDSMGWARIDPIGGTNYLFIAPFVLDVANPNTMYLAAGQFIWRNDSLGAIPLKEVNDSIRTGWKRLDATDIGYDQISCIATSSHPAHLMYFGTDDGRVFRVNNADGVSPVVTSISKGFNGSMYINCLAIDPTDGNKVLAVCSNYGVKSLFYTIDAGKTWTSVSANLEEKPNGSGNGPSCRAAKIMYGLDGKPYYFVGTSVGMFMSKQLKGDSTLWVQEGNTTIGNMDVEMIDGRASDGLLVAATYGAGVFSADFNTLIGIDENKSMAHGYFMENVFPNPAIDKTNVNLYLEKPAKVIIQLFDLSGKMLRSLPIQTYMEGNNSIPVSLSGLPSGTYLCKVEVNGHSEVKKILKIAE